MRIISLRYSLHFGITLRILIHLNVQIPSSSICLIYFLPVFLLISCHILSLCVSSFPWTLRYTTLPQFVTEADANPITKAAKVKERNDFSRSNSAIACSTPVPRIRVCLALATRLVLHAASPTDCLQASNPESSVSQGTSTERMHRRAFVYVNTVSQSISNYSRLTNSLTLRFIRAHAWVFTAQYVFNSLLVAASNGGRYPCSGFSTSSRRQLPASNSDCVATVLWLTDSLPTSELNWPTPNLSYL
jgi:hypothetical protein